MDEGERSRSAAPTVNGYEVITSSPVPRPAASGHAKAERSARRVTEPTEPDPHGGRFTVEQATAGLGSEGALVAEIRTDLGTLFCDLFEDKAPLTVANFVGLSRGLRAFWDERSASWTRRPLYTGTTFHRVIPGYLIQAGDPAGDGTGGVGYTLRSEAHPSLRHDRAGQLCMANRGADTHGGQFFITDGAAPQLDRSSAYTIFGQCRPTDLVSRIARVPQSGRPDNRPLTPVRILEVRIRRLHGGAEAAMSGPEKRPPTGGAPRPSRGASPGPSEIRSRLKPQP